MNRLCLKVIAYAALASVLGVGIRVFWLDRPSPTKPTKEIVDAKTHDRDNPLTKMQVRQVNRGKSPSLAA